MCPGYSVFCPHACVALAKRRFMGHRRRQMRIQSTRCAVGDLLYRPAPKCDGISLWRCPDPRTTFFFWPRWTYRPKTSTPPFKLQPERLGSCDLKYAVSFVNTYLLRLGRRFMPSKGKRTLRSSGILIPTMVRYGRQSVGRNDSGAEA